MHALSVIIPTYNRKNLIKYTLSSLDKRHHPGIDIEIIVVDDNSTDGTTEFISKEFPDVLVVKNEGNGASAARNTGLKLASKKYIMYLDSDDGISPGYFAAKIKLLNNQSDIDACYGLYETMITEFDFNPNYIIFTHKYPVITSVDAAGLHLINYLAGNYIPQNAFVWRKDFLLKIKGHDESLIVNQDVDLVVRSLFRGLKLLGVQDQTFAFIRQHEIDARVGIVNRSGEKLSDILKLRKKINSDLNNFGFSGIEYKQTLSMYLFEQWRVTRHFEKAIASQFLMTARQIYWPIKIKGNAGFRSLAKIVGPVTAVRLKYFLLKRD